MKPLDAGERHVFASAQRTLTVLGHICYDDMVRYRVEGDADVHAIDHFVARRRERALNRVASGAVELKGDRIVYLGAEFRRRASTRRSPSASGGDLGGIAPLNASIEEVEYVREGAGSKSLLSITSGGTTAWYLATESRLDPEFFIARSPARYRSSELAALAAHICLAASIFHGLLTHPSDNYYFWSERIQGLMVFEFILVAAGTMLILMREGVTDRKTGKVVPAPAWVPFTFLVFGLVYGLALFKFSVLFLVYMARLVAVMWTGFTVPAERAFEEGQRRALGMVAYISIGFVITIMYGNGGTAFMKWGVLYFFALALIELFMLLRRPPAGT